MSPRRPAPPAQSTAASRAAGRPPAGRPSAGRATGRPADRPSSARRAPTRPQTGTGTPAYGLGAGGRTRRPVIRPLTVLSGVLVVLVLMLAPYVRPWVTQRSQIAEGSQKVAELQQEVDDLSQQRHRWDDPAYVRAQARERLHFVMPGETGYVVLDDTGTAPSAVDPRSAAATLPGTSAHSDQPWYARVWQSVQIAGDPTTEQARSADPR